MPQQKKPPVIPSRPKVKPPSRSKGAVAERKLPLEWYYISFASDSEFLGSVIVEAHGPLTAVERATERGINPGGEAACAAVGVKHLRKVQLDLVNKLLTEAQVRGRLGGTGIWG
jgi:hypothetical protein